MSNPNGDPRVRNLLLATLPPDLLSRIEPHLETVRLEQRTAIEYPGEAFARVIFPIDCVGSMVAIAADGRRIEVGLFGVEGMSGTSLLTGCDPSPLETFMQLAGSAYAIDTATLRTLLDEAPALRAHFLRYLHCLSIQTTQTALSNGLGKLEERLARWLLMCHDRVPGDRLDLTHEFLSVMLGVRRAGVTVGTHILEGKALIRAERGRMTILDRPGLEAEARGSYGVSEGEYERIFGCRFPTDREPPNPP